MAARAQKPAEMVRLGETIRGVRESKGLSQQDLATISKLHRNYIGGIERAERNITILSLIKLAEALDTPASRILKLAKL